MKRPPIITIVGHIDHGKSTLLDYLRKTKKVRKEAGNITQHTSAYEIESDHEGKKRLATIIDTPGHEVFTNIRESSVAIADIVLLIIASDDGFKEQTKEALNIIKQEKKPYIVVFTKTDLPNAKTDEVKYSLSEKEILLEGLGGDIPFAEISAKEGVGVDELLDVVFLLSDLQEENKKEPIGTVIESHVDSKVGITSTIIVKSGSIETGKVILIKDSMASVKSMKDDSGKKIEEALPSKPVMISGFNKLPEIGEDVKIFNTKKDAEKEIVKDEKTQENIVDHNKNVIPVIIKADTLGGLTSLKNKIRSIERTNIDFKIIKENVGPVTEEDIKYASGHTGSIVLGFHTKVDSNATQSVNRTGVLCKVFETIYDLTTWIDDFADTKRKNFAIEECRGVADVIKLFEEQKTGEVFIAGAQIQEGCFEKEQTILVKKGDKETGEFIIEKIEQKNKEVEKVEGIKTQFAFKVKGKGSIDIGDKIYSTTL